MVQLVITNHCESFVLSSRLFVRLGIRRESKLVDGFYLTLWGDSPESGRTARATRGNRVYSASGVLNRASGSS